MPLEIKTTIEQRKKDFFYNAGFGFAVRVKRRTRFDNIVFWSDWETKAFIDKLSKIKKGCYSFCGDSVNGFFISKEDSTFSAYPNGKIVLLRTREDAQREQSRLQKLHKKGGKYFVKAVSLSDLVGGEIKFL